MLLEADEECPDNVTMLEGFEWYAVKDSKHWLRLRDAMPGLKAIGIDNIWIPPGCKGGWHGSNGYDTYDLYDLGEFDQKDSRATGWGTKEELLDMIGAARANGIGIYWDAVLNHKAAADYSTRGYATKVDPKGTCLPTGSENAGLTCCATDRTRDVGKPFEIDAWVGFDYRGRGGAHSSMRYGWDHFNATDYDAITRSNDIFRFVGGGKNWAPDVDDESGNADYLYV